ncbi:enoyl-CoA hydratase-related protein [Nesterenkonia sp. LB17]|uniref:enoyl-CoA hydratase-related protein n=1 Tax=Nesterenkonia sp. LB17 TaxID=2901230 RepID=UPI001F4D2CBD|nr:enoyl-CoA hydratase-related protein [Nesterenkonia sp. LB17]MCH8566008.1 enoyl-CoA hydratase-related protein [Nesterenkonia sp. LB17]
MTEYSTILVSTEARVGRITLNRPESLNALTTMMMEEVVHAAGVFDASPDIGAILVTGSDKAFAAGADINEMSEQDHPGMYAADWFRRWDDFTRLRTPIVAAVNGYALGGGCELAMMADVIVAGEGARFGQPEINLGVIPGMGASQRLTRSVGKAKAMDMILTGRHIHADEAERIGLVSRVVADEDTVAEATKVAELIASKSKPAAQMGKEAVGAAFDSTLHQGLAFERRMFHSLFSLEDQSEGMSAFIQKREPQWRHR